MPQVVIEDMNITVDVPAASTSLYSYSYANSYSDDYVWHDPFDHSWSSEKSKKKSKIICEILKELPDEN
jgi:hypothetical protein